MRTSSLKRSRSRRWSKRALYGPPVVFSRQYPIYQGVCGKAVRAKSARNRAHIGLLLQTATARNPQPAVCEKADEFEGCSNFGFGNRRSKRPKLVEFLVAKFEDELAIQPLLYIAL